MIRSKSRAQEKEKDFMGRVSDAKERLMEAVLELIWKGSYGSTTIDQICEKAGVKKGSFYYFFDSKAELAETALDEDWQRHRVELDSIFYLLFLLWNGYKSTAILATKCRRK